MRKPLNINFLYFSLYHQTIFPDRCFKEIPNIPVNDADAILASWLSSSQRTLIPAQKETVLKAFQECPLPLYLKLSFDQACRWRSYTPANETALASNVKDVVNDLLDQVERRHGTLLVSHALAYITASKNGLTEPELEDILSLDDEVLNDVYQYWTPPFRRLPPLLWIRIRSDIGDYLIERGADDSRVIYWYHRQFIEVATDRYLRAKQEVHSKLADYFVGKWSNGARKPYVDKDKQTVLEDRLVAKQPLTFTNEKEKREVFNLRKLSELPYHLLHSGDLKRLKDETLCNFEFLLAKLRATSLDSVLDDFVASLLVYPEEEDLVELEKTLQLSSVALKADANQLAPQLLGRLIAVHSKDEFHGINLLLQQAYSSSVPCLIPSDKCLTSPGGSLISSMKLPGESIFQCCGFSCDGKTAYVTTTFSEPVHIQILTINLQNGKTLRRVTLPGSLEVGTVWSVEGSRLNEDLLLLVGSTDIFLINTTTGQVVQRISALEEESQYNPMPPVSFVDDEARVVAITDKDLKIWTTEDGRLVHKIDIGKIPIDDEYGAIGAAGFLAAFSIHGAKSFTVLDTRTGVKVRDVNVFSEADAYCIGEIKVTSKEQVVVTSSERNNLRLYDLRTGSFIREVPQFKINKGLLRLQVTTDGTKAVCVADYEIHVTNLKDGTVHKTLKSKSFGTLIIHSNFYTRDGKFSISVAHDGVIRIYDLEQALKENTEEVSTDAATGHKAVSSVDSINYLGCEADHRHVIATATVNNTSQILIWDALTGTKVRTLQMNQELPPTTIRMYGTSRAVGYIHDLEFLHFEVYDLKLGKVERHLQGKASKRTEAFGFIDENQLISLSRGRRNLKVWNISNGKLVKQYKFGQKHRFEDMLLSRNGRSVVCSQVSQRVDYDDETLSLVFLNTQTEDQKFLQVESTQLMLWNGSITDDGCYLVCLTKDLKALLWDLTDGHLKHRLVADDENPTVTSTAISSASSIVLTGEGDGGISVWDIGSGHVRYTFKCETVDSLFVTKDGQIAFSNYRYQNSSIDAWDLGTGVKLASFTSDWKPERMTICGYRLVVAKPDKPELMTLRPHIPGQVETTTLENFPFANCPLESQLQSTEDPAGARGGDEDEDADDDPEVTDFQKTEFTRKAVHARPDVILGGGSTVFASKNVFISEKVYQDNCKSM